MKTVSEALKSGQLVKVALNEHAQALVFGQSGQYATILDADARGALLVAQDGDQTPVFVAWEHVYGVRPVAK